VAGCKDVSDIEPGKANELFDLIDKFAGYGFNKSHAAAYALLAYQTGWLKAHYPHEFYAASMCYDMHQSEKLAVFVDDMRRAGIDIAGPDINASEAEFIVEQTDEGHAVRYALAGVRNVGEKAMDAIVAEREENGAFASLEDLFRRVPHGSMNRRQLEGLAASGAFDALEANRAKIMANADMLLAVADEAARSRTSGQAALFGGDDEAEPALRLADAEPWDRTEQMEKERENFGFYFAAHPVEAFRQIASANGARTHASIISGGVDGAQDRRPSAVMAVLVEGASKRQTRRGKDYVMGEFSDATGQFSASCFEEGMVEPMLRWAKEGTCVLLNVELDRPSPDEPPRVTVRGARPLAEVTSTARMLLTLDVMRVEAIQELALLLEPGEKGRGEVMARLVLEDGQQPMVRLGRDFGVDGELVDRLSTIEGVSNVQLTTRRGGDHLRLVA
jgi:DNA polymerase-3 subunit alpha